MSYVHLYSKYSKHSLLCIYIYISETKQVNNLKNKLGQSLQYKSKSFALTIIESGQKNPAYFISDTDSSITNKNSILLKCVISRNETRTGFSFALPQLIS